MSTQATTTFQLTAADISWGRRECYTVKVNSDAVTIKGKFYLADALSSDFGSNVEYYVWFDDGIVADPAPASKTAITVDITSATTAVDVAAALQVALEANVDFRAKLDAADTTNTTVIQEGQFKGAVTNDTVDSDSLNTIVQQRDGIGNDLGTTIGGIEITMETTTAQITVDQKGVILQDEFLTGQTIETTMSFAEMTRARWELIVGEVSGDTFTPSGGTKLTGFGESRLYQSLFDLGGELVLHPTNRTSSDKDFDFTFFKSSPKPSSYNFSGEEASVLEVTFTALADKDTQAAINLMAFGDSSQDVRV